MTTFSEVTSINKSNMYRRWNRTWNTKLVWMGLAGVLSTTLPACAGELRSAPVSGVLEINTPLFALNSPPAMQIEEIGPERAGYFWVSGFWDYNGSHHIWRPGHYERNRDGYRYEPSRWERDGDRYRLNRGHFIRHTEYENSRRERELNRDMRFNGGAHEGVLDFHAQ